MNLFLGPYFEVLRAAIDLIGIGLVVVEDRENATGTKKLADEHGIPVRILTKETALPDIWPDDVEIAVVAGFGKLLRRPVLDRARVAINFHPGIVEQNRGRHGLLTAAYHKHESMGITCHVIDSEQIDAGPIIAQYQLPIDYSANFDSNHARLRKVFEPMARLVLGDYIDAGRVTARPWSATAESYFPPLSEQQIQKVLNAATLGSL